MRKRSWGLLFAFSIFLGFLPPARAEESTFFLPAKGGSATKLVVFVHGFTGGARKTWTNKRTGFFWPAAINDQPEFRDADVLSFGYKTNCSLGPTPDETSRDLADAIRDLPRAKAYREISFVAHSLGGTVVRSLVLNERIELTRVKHIVALATPSSGSDLAAVGRLFCAPFQVSALLKGRGTVLDLINDTWRDKFETQRRDLPFSYLAAYELLPFFWFGIIVDKPSATLFAHGIKAVDRNHKEISKPADEADPLFRRVNRELLGEGAGSGAGAGGIALRSAENAVTEFFELKRRELGEAAFGALGDAYEGAGVGAGTGAAAPPAATSALGEEIRRARALIRSSDN